jgi:hypothetical protein
MAEKMVKKHNKEDEVLSKKDKAREDDQTSTLTPPARQSPLLKISKKSGHIVSTTKD